MRRIRFGWSVRGRFLFTIALYGIVGLGIHIDKLFLLTGHPSAPFSADAWRFSAEFTALLVLATLLHELGHALVGIALGLRWVHLELGWGAGVLLEGPRTYHKQLLISLAGPLVQLTFGVVLLIANPFATSAWFAGAWTVIASIFNLLLSGSGRSDGSKIRKCLTAIRFGAGSESYEE